MNEGLIPRRYANALLMVASDKGNEAKMYELMKQLDNSFVEMPGLSETLNNPYIAQSDKGSLILTAAGVRGGEIPLFDDFLKLLEENHRIGMIRLIAMAYVDLYRERHHIYRVEVTSAAPLDRKDEERLRALVTRHLNGGTMEFISSVDPSLIGGFTVSVGNEKVDASVSNELKQLRLNLLSK